MGSNLVGSTLMPRVRPEGASGHTALMRRRFDAVKEGVPVATLARDLVSEGSENLREAGARLRGICVLCGHGGHSGAFSCEVGSEGKLWHCFACGEGGDVIRLAQLAGGFVSPGEATAWLGWRYGVELPSRPDSWYAKEDRQERTRAAIEEKKRMVKRRRLFRVIMIPLLRSTGATPEEVKAAWEDFEDLPLPS